MTANPQQDIQIEYTERLAQNASALQVEMNWFEKVLEARVLIYLENECAYRCIYDLPAPDLTETPSDYTDLVLEHKMMVEERLVLMLAIIPHLKPQLLNLFLCMDQSINKPFIEFGGWQGKRHHGFLPTGESAMFLLSGGDTHKRLQMLSLLERDHFFTRDGILDIQQANYNESYLTSPLVLTNEYFHRITTGQHLKPDYSMHFPASLISTNLHWDDLVLPAKVMADIEHIQTWLAHQKLIMKGMGLDRSIKPGYRALFYGPPGTGKTLTASLLGRSTNMDVYRIDLSAVVSKYIGETEKNLENIFKQAEKKQWILFFDEADALFGKRTSANSSNDRHANQEISYLLQRVESYPGVVILATNLKGNIDEAFSRRFQSVTYFPVPDKHLRLLLWEKALSSNNNNNCLHDDIDLMHIAGQYELAGGAIINVVRFSAINAIKMKRDKIQQDDLIQGITKELRKEGRML